MMKYFISLLLWFILLVLCWPLAFIALFILFIAWLIMLPFRILGFTLHGIFKIAEAIITFPFRMANLTLRR